MTQQASMSRLRPVIRVFVSSTFSDMKHERNALAADAFPTLEQLCQRHGFQFQAIDLRWGVSTEAGLDHRTMRICIDELRRAQEISPKPNFLILLGNRYGWRPLPEEISVEEFHTLEHAAAQISGRADKSPVVVLREWYREDTNTVPPVYLLQSRRQDLGDNQDYTHDAVWNKVQTDLWTIINRAMPPEQLQRRFDSAASDGSPPTIVRFQASATEQEIWHGALRVPDAREHVLAFFREIGNLADFSDPNQIKDFVDVDPSGRVEATLQTEQDRLKAELRQRLGSANVFRNEAPARLVEAQDKQGGRAVDVTTDHLAQLCADVVRRLSEIIQSQIDDYWRNTAQASTDRAERELEIEQREYERFAQERGGEESFVGRQDELQAILDYVGNDSRWPLVVHGASGCGKTALLARASQEVAKTRKRIERFIGVAPRSSDIRSLLSSLCQELRQRSPRSDALPTEIKELRDEFFQHLQAATPEQPLILFLDALDQLADVYGGRLLNWLPPGSLPAHVKLVVSCLSDRDTGDPSGQPYAELERRQIPAENFKNLDELSEAEAGLLLFDRWLPQAGRKVSVDQRAQIEQRLASPACRQPIFLKLLFEEVRLWHSYDPAPVPGDSVPALLWQLFDRLGLETNHGPLLVNRVLGYLSASRHGLAENEILEILFADPEYRAKLKEATEQTRHELPPNAKHIPIALWSRLRFDLAPYLTERAAPGANVLTFYHRQVAERVQDYFAAAPDQHWQPHQRLTDYFRYLADPEGNHSWKGDSPRPFIELPFHMARANADELVKTLFDCNWLQAKVSKSLLIELIDDYDEAMRCELASSLDYSDLQLVQDCLRLSAHVTSNDPRQLASQIIGRIGSFGNQSAKTLVRSFRDWRGATWLCPDVPSLTPPNSGLVRVISCNGACIRSLFFTTEGDYLIAECDDLKLRAWDLRSGEESPALDHRDVATYRTRCVDQVRALLDDRTKIVTLAIDAGNRIAVCALSDATIKVLDLATGHEVHTLTGHQSSIQEYETDLWNGEERRVPTTRWCQITAIAIIEEGRRAISVSEDCSAIVWDLSSGRRLHTFAHGVALTSVAASLGSNWIVTGSRDGMLRIWDLATGVALRTYDGQCGEIKALAVSADGQYIASGSKDERIRIWSAVESATRVPRSGHQDWVRALGIDSAGQLAFSASDDHSVGVWDLRSGKCIRMLGGHIGIVMGVTSSVDGCSVFTGSADNTLRKWNVESGRLIGSTLHKDWVSAVSRTPDGSRVLTGCHDGVVRIWDCANLAEIFRFTGHESIVTSLAVSPDGRSALSGSYDTSVRLWDIKTGAELKRLVGHTNTVSGVAFVGTSATAVSSSWDGTVRLWDLVSGIELARFRQHGRVNCVVVTANGKLVLCTVTDNTLNVWDLQTRKRVATFSGESGMLCAAIAPDDRRVVAAEQSGRIHFLRLIFPEDPC